MAGCGAIPFHLRMSHCVLICIQHQAVLKFFGHDNISVTKSLKGKVQTDQNTNASF